MHSPHLSHKSIVLSVGKIDFIRNIVYNRFLNFVTFYICSPIFILSSVLPQTSLSILFLSSVLILFMVLPINTLVHSCFSLPRLSLSLHTCTASLILPALSAFDNIIRGALSDLPLSEWTWLKASLPSSLGVGGGGGGGSTFAGLDLLQPSSALTPTPML